MYLFYNILFTWKILLYSMVSHNNIYITLTIGKLDVYFYHLLGKIKQIEITMQYLTYVRSKVSFLCDITSTVRIIKADKHVLFKPYKHWAFWYRCSTGVSPLPPPTPYVQFHSDNLFIIRMVLYHFSRYPLGLGKNSTVRIIKADKHVLFKPYKHRAVWYRCSTGVPPPPPPCTI